MAEMRMLYLSSKPEATRCVLRLRAVEVTQEAPARKYMCWVPHDATEDLMVALHIPGVRELAFPPPAYPLPAAAPYGYYVDA